ncbi:MAG: hypothetical protein LBS03_06100 [Bacteroidales bacterium]|jgi:hypothetical protein|nr:hypothetical protein [Bacteroidales bacterium]
MIKICTLLAAVVLWSTPAGTNAGDDWKNKVKGKWEIAIPDAPEGYRQFICEIKENKEKIIVADIKGEEINIKEQKFTEKNRTLTASFYAGEYVDVTIWEEKGVVKGTVDTSMGKLNCRFKKAAEKKEK